MAWGDGHILYLSSGSGGHRAVHTHPNSQNRTPEVNFAICEQYLKPNLNSSLGGERVTVPAHHLGANDE